MLLPVLVEHVYSKLVLYLMIFFIQMMHPVVRTFNLKIISHLTLFHVDNLAGGALAMPDSMDIDTLAQPPDKATYAEQANKRNHCRRLTK